MVFWTGRGRADELRGRGGKDSVCLPETSVLAVTENRPRALSQEALLGLATTETATLDGHVCRCMLSLHGWWTRMPPHQLVSARQLTSQKQTSSGTWGKLASLAREGSCPEKCTPALPAAVAGGGLQGTLPSPLTGFWVAFFQHPASEHLFFPDPNDDMAVRSLSDCSTSSVLNGVNILFGSNSFGPRIHWRTGSQTRSFFQPAPSDARHTFWIARLALRWSPLSPLFPSSLRHEPLVCRACFLDMMRRRPGLRRAKIANQLDPNGPMDATGRRQAMRSVTGGQ